MSSKPIRLTPSRRSVIAATAGLAASAALGNYAGAQIAEGDLPEAGPALTQMMPAAAPPLHFTDGNGKYLSLANFVGHGLVVNFWATWCGPCVAEIPSFAAIAPALAHSQILVLPISLDMRGLQAVRPFFASHGITNLPILLDVSGGSLDTLNAQGIPVTIIINPAGQLVARLDGAANWNTAGTIKTIRQLTGGAAHSGGSVMPVSG